MADIKIKRHAVISSNIKSVGYSAEERLLDVEYAGNNVYRYFDVPPNLVEQALQAESVGKFIYANIRGVYTFRQILADGEPYVQKEVPIDAI